MKFRTGDILLWSSVVFWDILSEYTLGLKGLHSSVIFVGSIFEQLSECGPSPSHTYVSFQIDRVYPIEEIVGQIWVKPNGSSLYVIQRKMGRDILEQEAYDTYIHYKNMETVNSVRRTRLAVLAYFRMGEYDDNMAKHNINYGLCPWFVAYMLDKFNILKAGADLNTLLPVDFYNLKFNQKDKYRRIDIFDKGTFNINWLFSSFSLAMGMVEAKRYHHPLVEEIIGKYDFPRVKKSLR